MEETCRVCLVSDHNKEKMNINYTRNGKTYAEVLEFLSGMKVN